MPTSSLPRQIARTRRFTAGAPSHFTLGPRGATVLFLRSRAGDDPVNCLWALDVSTGRERLLADPAALPGAAGPLPEAERVRRERARTKGAGIVEYAVDERAELAAFALSGRLWAVGTAGGGPRQLPARDGVVDPRPDPTGRRIAYVSDGALRVIEADGTGDRAVPLPASVPGPASVTAGPQGHRPSRPARGQGEPAAGPGVVYGLAEHVAAESMHRSRGYWWSPDGTRLLVAHADSSRVALWYAGDPADPASPPRPVRYPAAGTANARVTLWIADPGPGGDAQDAAGPAAPVEVRWEERAAEYVPAAGWDAHGPYAAVQTRDQRTVTLLAIDPDDGGTSTLSEQHDACWVQLVPGLPARTPAGRLLGHADLDGTRHLTLDGRPVTPPGLQLRAVLGVDGGEDGDGSVLFTASADPAETALWSLRPGEDVHEISRGRGVHSGVRRGGTLVHTARTAALPGARTTVTRPGGEPLAIGSLAERPAGTLRVVPLVLGPRELRAHLFLPSWHGGSQRLPVLLDPYGGPALQKVTAERTWASYTSQWFAEAGFAVLVADGRGTPGRGPEWERTVHGDMFTSVLEDQVTALEEAARRFPELDTERVGIRGWSFGGSLAALAVLRRPDVFHAAVAGAAVTDQRLYDTHWRERFLGHPGTHPERYDACSLTAAAPALTRPLLLVHGLADDNVHPANLLRFSAALLAAGRPHEVLPLPRVTHQVTDETVAENLLLHQLAFLRRSLTAHH